MAIAASLLLLRQLATPEPAAVVQNLDVEQPAVLPAEQPTSLLEAEAVAMDDEVIATVNNQEITRHTWQQATRLDTVMSRLAVQQPPLAENTLDRLVNEIIVLDAVDNVPTPGSADIETRIAALAAVWNVTDVELQAALAASNLTYMDLTQRTSRLLQVEMALQQLAAQQENLDVWLSSARAVAEIGLYHSLAQASVAPTASTPKANNQVDAVEIAPVMTFAPPEGMAVAPYPGNAAPDFTLPQLEGEPLSLSSLRGKPTIINFWATWCPPCRRELPALQAAYTTHQNDIEFIAVDVKESEEAVAGFVQQLGLDFPVALDHDGQVSDIAYQVRGLPTTIFVDANGVVSVRHIGPLDEAAIASYLAPLLQPAPPLVAQTNAVEADTTPLASSTSDSDMDDNLPAMALTPAPDFTLVSASGTPVSLTDYRDKKNVVLVFYRGHT